jgi:hypothetical protein
MRKMLILLVLSGCAEQGGTVLPPPISNPDMAPVGPAPTADMAKAPVAADMARAPGGLAQAPAGDLAQEPADLAEAPGDLAQAPVADMTQAPVADMTEVPDLTPAPDLAPPPCGGLGQTCCKSPARVCTDAYNYCPATVCETCGGAGQVSCPGNRCQAPNRYQNGRCIAPTCGIWGLPCCSPTVCGGGVECCTDGNSLCSPFTHKCQ